MRRCLVGVLASGHGPAEVAGPPRLAASSAPASEAEPADRVAEAVLVETLGFDAFWLGVPPRASGAGGRGVSEPAGSDAARAADPGVVAPAGSDAPEPDGSDAASAASLLMLAAAAARTTRVRLGLLGVPLAALDPVRVAEDCATLDGLSGGRIELAVEDRGDPAAAGIGLEGERLRERLLLLRRLWTEVEVRWSGRFRAPLERVTVEPRPLQEPHPPVWVSGASARRAADLAAELGLRLLLPLPPPGVPAAAAGDAAAVARFRERAAAAGHDLAALRVGACHVVDAGAGTEAVDDLLSAREALGLELQLLRFDGGRLPHPARALERFAARVLPELRRAGAS